MEDKIQKFKEMIDESNNIVFFGGAGVISFIKIS